MSRSITDARQVTLRQFLQQIANSSTYAGTADSKPANQSELDNLLSAINAELTPLLRLSASSTPDLVVSVGAAILSNPESSYQRSIPHIGALLPNSFSSGTITFPSTSGGTITVSPGNNNTLTVASGNYIKVLIYMDATGALNVLPGLENAVEANAVVIKSPNNTLPIGYVTLQNVAGTIQNIAQNKIYQFGTGAGGGSGTGNASTYEESFKNTLVDSSYGLVSPYIASVDTDDLLDGASDAEYSLIDESINFTNIGDEMMTLQLADDEEFLNNTNPIEKIDLSVYWRSTALDDAATYQVSRNGGNEWQTITGMERVGNTDLFHGSHVFAQESVNQSLASLATVSSSFELNATTQQSIGQGFTLASKHLLKTVTLELNKAGSPAGNFYVQILKDSAGSPSTAADAVLAESAAIPLSSVSAGNSSLVVNIPDIYLIAGTYHVSIRTDATYKASFVTATTRLAWRGNAAASTPYMRTYNGTVWAVSTNNQVAYSVNGLTVDLRVKIIAGTADVKFEALGLFHELDPSGIVAGLKNREVFNFSGNSNTYQFTLTRFVPDPDMLKVYDVTTGQVYTYGAFSIDGQTVIFTSGQFAIPNENVTLVFDQMVGGSYDNSDLNALLLASNHLGSTDASIDKSVAGLGLFLRRPDGTLREIAIDDDDNIVVYSV
jgi:hypothetical protein